jgi:hypothetical protein
MLTAMQQQRDNALNAIVMMQADLADTRRALEDKDKEVAELRAQLAAASEDGLQG